MAPDRAAPQNISSSGHAVRECDICCNVMLDMHCKLRCTNCGFMRDCSDP